ncbi:MAG: hypothetical protein HGA80_06190 [Candidatus Omnitrophica bacterium]|nr:hypothetical protein [Candidatus Omnitrophota bacterium]
MAERMIYLGRLPIVGLFWRRKPPKNLLLALWDEANRNLERYYVVEQRNFITEPFDSEALDEARLLGGVKFQAELTAYASAIRDFNVALQDVKAFEGVYASGIDHKTRENAEILHAKKEALDEQFKRLYPVIVAAQKVLREMLV